MIVCVTGGSGLSQVTYKQLIDSGRFGGTSDHAYGVFRKNGTFEEDRVKIFSDAIYAREQLDRCHPWMPLHTPLCGPFLRYVPNDPEYILKTRTGNVERFTFSETRVRSACLDFFGAAVTQLLLEASNGGNDHVWSEDDWQTDNTLKDDPTDTASDSRSRSHGRL